MLVLTRKCRQKVMIGEDVEVVVTRVGRGRVILAIVAPHGMTVDRGEVWQRKRAEMAPTLGELPVKVMNSSPRKTPPR